MGVFIKITGEKKVIVMSLYIYTFCFLVTLLSTKQSFCCLTSNEEYIIAFLSYILVAFFITVNLLHMLSCVPE